MRYRTLSLLTVSLALAASSPRQQKPMADSNLGPAMPEQLSNPTTSTPPNSETVMLSDVLGNQRSINIFAGFTRDFAPISSRFEDFSSNTTILAPINSAIMSLPRKPWEDLKDYDAFGEQAYEGGNGEERAQENLRRFVEEHVVPLSPWKEGEKVKTLRGGEAWWVMKEGRKLIMPGEIEVDSVASRVYNGEVWVLKCVRNYA